MVPLHITRTFHEPFCDPNVRLESRDRRTHALFQDQWRSWALSMIVIVYAQRLLPLRVVTQRALMDILIGGVGWEACKR